VSVAWAGAVVTADAAVPAIAYLVAMRHVRQSGEPWPAARAAAFVAAMAIAAAVTAPAVDAHARRSLAWHMSQQMTLLLVVPPGLVAARPVELIRRATGWRGVHLPGPAAAWIAFVGLQWAIHVPAVLDTAVGNPPAEGLMHLTLVVAGVLFFAQVQGGRISQPLALGLYVVSAMPTTDAIALWLMFDPHLVYPAFAGPGALAGQRTAGVIMFAAGNLLLLTAALVVGRYLWEGRPQPPMYERPRFAARRVR
jgi:cytochrome c oxidase assembly factor CtaG